MKKYLDMSKKTIIFVVEKETKVRTIFLNIKNMKTKKIKKMNDFKFGNFADAYFKEEPIKEEKEVLVEVDIVSYPEYDNAGGGIITTKAWVYKKKI